MSARAYRTDWSLAVELSAPRVSVVVPTYNRSRHLAGCLPTLINQKLEDSYEVLVVDDGSSDDTEAVAQSWSERSRPPLRYVRIGHGGLNAARNAGLRNARGALLCFVDDDVRAPQGWLAALVAAAERHSEAACLGGPIRLVFEGRPPRTCGREPIGETNQDLGPVERAVESLFGSNLTITARGRSLGGDFDESLPSSGDEEEFLRRVRARGGELLYVPDAGVDHVRNHNELSVRWLASKRFRRGLDQTVFLASQGTPIKRSTELRHVLRCLGHAVRYRCFTGILDASFATGRLVGAITRIT